ncbi:unnamed protein product [Paramecium sonneborni]|uniref:Glycoside hydrolase family 31 TIM barrel domain-containing protein n=1 Tax=Paramecium sonneborni TaxID=65129 RepID=A0A8S1RPB2_9CILI|nr:unnamed protein product [Paramecium sonneborni]
MVLCFLCYILKLYNCYLNIFGFCKRSLYSLKIPKREFSIWNHDFWEFDTQVGYSLYGDFTIIQLIISHSFIKMKQTHDIRNDELEFKIFLGKKNPKELIKQYNQYLNGWELHQFWAFGWHQSRWGYQITSVIKDVIRNYKESDIPLEVIWTELDYMQVRKDFTLNEVLYPREDLQNITQQDGVCQIPILDLGIAIDGDCGRDLVKSRAYIKSNR